MAGPRYLIVNASNEVFYQPTAKGDALVQPSTRRVLELDEKLSDARIESYRSSNIFIKSTTEAAQNSEPLPPMDSEIASSRNQLMVASGQEREDIIETLWKGSSASKKAAAAAKSESAATTAAPSSTPAAQGATATAAPAASAGNTTTAGK